MLAVCLALVVPRGLGAEYTDKKGFYVIGDIGANFVQKLAFERIQGVDATGSASVEVHPGVRGTVGVGYAFLPQLAAELEGGFAYNETKTYSGVVGGVPLNGSIRLWHVPVTAGLTWRPPIPPPTPPSDADIQYGQQIFQRVHPFIGAGIGAAAVFGDIDIPAPTANGQIGSGRDTVLTYYAKAGLMFPLNSRTEIGVQYRFYGSTGFTIKDTQSDDIFAHAVSVALRIRF